MPRESPKRSEQEIFDDLASLCASPGYVHALAYFSFRDNIVRFGDQLQGKDIANLYGDTRLIRTEIATLHGLMLRAEVTYERPSAELLQDYVTRSEALLEELHNSLSGVWFAGLTPEKLADRSFDPFSNAAAMREPIFYAGESAYSFQYTAISARRYSRDAEWLHQAVGFDMAQAQCVALAIEHIQREKVMSAFRGLKDIPQREWTMLPGFEFEVAEVAAHSGLEADLVRRILVAFSVLPEERNVGFEALNDFNLAAAKPVLAAPDGRFILLQFYNLAEALYEAPFYWMVGHKHYSAQAMSHRGSFTEELAHERLLASFGGEHVFANVDVLAADGSTFGEIDVLVLFGDRAIVLQAKSKRLTLASRKGNDQQLRRDFKQAIQDAYEQARRCAEVVGVEGYTLVLADGSVLPAVAKPAVVYPVCIVSDHYPALAFQARQFLQYEATDFLRAPLVTDVFAIDVMAEMLDSPLRFLSYLDLRAIAGDKFLTSHELTLLSFHLKRNLWVGEEFDLMFLQDDIATDLDIAMMSRRVGLPGNRTPDGILTRLRGTTLGTFIDRIEATPHPGTIDLGLMLLSLSEQSIKDVSGGMDKVTASARLDRRNHDITVAFDGPSTGLTVHANYDPPQQAANRLEKHSRIRKHASKAATWFGLVLDPDDSRPRLALELKEPWKPDEVLDRIVATMPKPVNAKSLRRWAATRNKPGRNDPCPCGSGRKYKKCCFGRVG